MATEYKDAASRAGRPFVPTYLSCDLGTNLERVASIDRLNRGTKKLTDVQVLGDLSSRCELFRFDDCPGLTVDSTNAPPVETAPEILTFLQNDHSFLGSGQQNTP